MIKGIYWKFILNIRVVVWNNVMLWMYVYVRFVVFLLFNCDFKIMK